MKQLILTVILILSLGSICYAEDTQNEPIAFAPAIEGQFIYDMDAGQIVPALGLQVARAADGILEARILATGSPDSISELGKVGVGLGVNLPKLTTKIGAEWVAKIIDPSIGLAGLYDMKNGGASWGIYVVIIKVAL